MMLPHLATHLYGVPLMIHRLKLGTLLAVLGERIGLSNSAVKPFLDLQEIAEQENQGAIAGIAVIQIYGALVRRTLGLEAQSGLVSYGGIATQVVAALADPDIAAILLDIDSAGGEAGGAFDLTDFIYASRGQKPIWAIANDSCFSAAYAIGSAADKLFVTRTGGVGSIGVIALHVDQSQADAKDGLTYTTISAGAHKNDLSPHAPLADSAKSALQSEVNRIYDLFTATVARNRQRSADFVRQTEAGLFFGPDAVTAGLADGVTNFSDAVALLTQQISQQISKPPPAMSVIPTPVKEIHMQQTENTPAPAISMDSGSQYSHAVEIAQLCQLAGMPDKTAEFLASNQSVTQVRQTLLAAKAAVPAISSHIDPQHNPQRTDLLMKVIKQRVGKEN